MTPKTAFPGAAIVGLGSSVLVNSGATVVGALPTTLNGQRPAFVRVTVANVANFSNVAAAYFRLSPNATSASVVTSDTIVSANEALWLNTMGMNAFAALTAIGAQVRVQISPLEEGVIVPSQQASGLG